MRTSIFILAFACIAALGLAGYFFMQNQQTEQALTNQMASLDESQEALRKVKDEAQLKTAEDNKALELAQKLAQEQKAQAKLAKEAARMAELKANQETAERHARFQKLNDMLAREVAAREQAEQAATELEVQIKRLEEAMALAAQDQMTIVEQQRSKSATILSEQKKILEEIERHKRELNALVIKQKTVHKNHAQILANQIEIEEKILSEGGEITIPNYRIWSPNYRPIRNKAAK